MNHSPNLHILISNVVLSEHVQSLIAHVPALWADLPGVTTFHFLESSLALRL